MRRFVLIGSAAVVAAALSAIAHADDEPDNAFVAAIVDGTPIIDLRYRYETKNQDGFADDAQAHTLRARLGYETGDFHGWKLLAEFEGVAAIGDDRFNSTTNGRTGFPVVADPDAAELNRLQLTYTGVDKTTAIFGRQRINIGNQRFIGAVGFRQNEQTFDAVRVTVKPNEKVSLDYAYIGRVHRIFGDDHPAGEFDSDSHVLTAAYDAGDFGKITGYGYLIDLDEAPALSSATWGARYENSFALADEGDWTLAVVGELAAQSDYGGNAADYDETYALAEAALSAGGFTGALGFERLGGDGVIGFSTPLATLHKFQGFADVFLTTPAAGVEDVYVGAAYKLTHEALPGPVRLFVVHHDFQSAKGSLDFGRETDLGAAVVLSQRWSAELKAAFYDGGDNGFADRDLVWATLAFGY